DREPAGGSPQRSDQSAYGLRYGAVHGADDRGPLRQPDPLRRRTLAPERRRSEGGILKRPAWAGEETDRPGRRTWGPQRPQRRGGGSVMANGVPRRDVLKGIGGLAMGGVIGALGAPQRLGAQRRFDGETLRAQLWAGPEGQTIQTYVIEPFMKRTGAKVVATEGVTSLSPARMRAGKGKPNNTHYLTKDSGGAPAG